MRVEILGPPRVVGPGGVVAEIGGQRLRALLVRLALAAGRVVTVEELAEALWPEDKPVDPANAVQSLVSRLRRSLPDSSPLRSEHGGYRLALSVADVDAHLFERLAREGRLALAGGDPATAVARLGEALALWRGPALGDVAAEPFAAAYAAGLEEARLGAVEDRAEAALACGGPVGELVAELHELTARHPLRERLLGLRVKALYAAGRQAEALAAYEGFRRMLADRLGADPGAELKELHLAILRGDGAVRPVRADGGAARRAGRPRGNLPAALTSFVGREAEVELIDDRLAAGRLVTLVGPGGAGKTRLATTVAERVAGRMPGGVWLVELAPVTEPADVAQAVLGVLPAPGLRDDPRDQRRDQRDTMDRLVEALSAPGTLVVLDNCEHVVDAAARLADELLGRCPELRVIATSREPLAITGESLCPVPPLALPDPGAGAEEAPASPAVRLFLDRAGAVRPGFALTAENAATVVEVCRRLDGLPLAIELAAARLRSLTLEQVAARLDDRFRLLTGGSRAALPRHQTLRAVVAWSWDLLDADERRFAEWLAVFPAGCTLEAAERVCPPSGRAALDLLAALVDKSLLQLAEGPRYRMLETIREYALERLAEAGESRAGRAAHAAYFLELAETAERRLRGREQVVWLNRVMAERDNMLAALHFAVDTGDADTAVRLGAALGITWTMYGNRAESVTWLERALSVRGPAPDTARRLLTAAYLISKAVTGGYEKMAATIGEMAALVRDLGPFPAHPVLALLEPAMSLFVDDTVNGRAAIEQRMAHPDPWVRAVMLMMRAAIHENDGLLREAVADLDVAVARFREIGDRWGLSMSLTSLGELRTASGDLDGAVEALEEAARLLVELKPGDRVTHQRIWLSYVYMRRGEAERARAELRDIAAAWQYGFSVHDSAFAYLALGDLARWEGDLEQTRVLYERAKEVMRHETLISPQFQSLLLTAEAVLLSATGDLAGARRCVAEALEHALEAKDMPVASRVAVAAAVLEGAQAEHEGRGFEDAAALLGAGERLRGADDATSPEVRRLAARLRERLGAGAYAAAYGRGLALDRDGALDLVRRV
ncbi:putative ATPase/DNA-binding SARP family transcriptional activator [Thermocatellispora tengchongensis]|uniref:Putative ATPase/DNA-binding SARP family transcriptional activator n=1 Tax=Thermocatellispora tengchongensis TaxID=1073253 RepID=A0A840NQ14_9ACTN|nr:BTAD domain-containing putative transcriptional regulator [Thermocatellispora tengchongensis]MBB5130644.1 putative ATPase/DNA-binding SARP family transcriptional activator [Thermocatellispora tengchongensis]